MMFQEKPFVGKLFSPLFYRAFQIYNYLRNLMIKVLRPLFRKFMQQFCKAICSGHFCSSFIYVALDISYLCAEFCCCAW